MNQIFSILALLLVVTSVSAEERDSDFWMQNLYVSDVQTDIKYYHSKVVSKIFGESKKRDSK